MNIKKFNRNKKTDKRRWAKYLPIRNDSKIRAVLSQLRKTK